MYLTGREHTPISVIKHEEHFDFVPRITTSTEKMDVDDEEEDLSGITDRDTSKHQQKKKRQSTMLEPTGRRKSRCTIDKKHLNDLDD